MKDRKTYQVTTLDGYTLIELVIVMLFTGVIITTLFSSFSLFTRVSRFVDSLINRDVSRALIVNQLQKDLAGAFLPVQALPDEKKETTAEESDRSQVVDISKPSPEIKKKHLSDPFIIQEKNNRVSILSFISRNPLRVYQKEKGVEEKTRVVRILYQLIEEKERPGYFALFRQQGTELDSSFYMPKNEKEPYKIEVARGIKEFKVVFTGVKKQGDKKNKREFVETSVWPMKDETLSKQFEPLPVKVEVEISLWNDFDQPDTTKFSFQIGS